MKNVLLACLVLGAPATWACSLVAQPIGARAE
jgi:hypothetical protein